MIVKITSKRQVTLPAHVLDEMGVGPGDTLQLIPGPDGYLLRPRRIDYSRLGTLRGNLPEGLGALRLICLLFQFRTPSHEVIEPFTVIEQDAIFNHPLVIALDNLIGGAFGN